MKKIRKDILQIFLKIPHNLRKIYTPTYIRIRIQQLKLMQIPADPDPKP
jgi:hypothetical protein